MIRLSHTLALPVRLSRRFEEFCERPGSLEAVICTCDQALPMIAVTIGSIFLGTGLAVAIAAICGH